MKGTPFVRHGILPAPEAVDKVEPDWAAYFRAFCAAHTVNGGGPVVDGGVLLFADGWRYSADDYGGPEWAPPAELEHLLELQRRYWRRRLKIVRAERDGLAFRLEGLANLQRDRRVPLFRRGTVLDPETGYLRNDPKEIDWFALAERLRWLTRDVQECARELLTLGEDA